MKLVQKYQRSLVWGVTLGCPFFLALAAITFAQAAPVKVLGTVKSSAGNSIVLTTDSGSETTVNFTDSTRILKVLPGQSIKDAVPVQVSEVKVGDRILAAGQPGEANATVASTIVVMKQSDIADKQQQEREQWRRGVGGIVKEVNAPAGTIAIANSLVASGKPIVIHVSPATEIRRYSPDSVKFDDAKPGKLEEIKAGDQLRARGEKNADGTEFAAQAIVSGAFREIAGTVVSADSANGSITINDLATKKPVTLKITADSQLHKLPQFLAQRLAMRLKGGAAADTGAPAANDANAENRTPGPSTQGNWRGQGSASAAASPAAPNGNWRAGAGSGAPDFQQMLSRMPSVAVSDLQKGDAVILVATQGSATSAPTAITLLSGVEPILTAVPGGASAAMILSPWNLGGSPGGEAAAQ